MNNKKHSLGFSESSYSHLNRAQPSQPKVAKVMREFKQGSLHSGSPSGPIVTSRPQAIAVALSSARKKKP